MRTYILLLLILKLLTPTQAQKHDYHWVMGRGFGVPYSGSMNISFHTTPPSIDTLDLNMNFQRTATAFSDSFGNILFYSNGIKIYNKNRELMQNGNGINPGDVWQNTQEDGYIGTTIFGFYAPKNDSLVYLIHTRYPGSPYVLVDRLYYSIINIKSNNGLGKVVSKNQILLEGDQIWPCAVKHGNGRDWWIMTGLRNSPDQYLYLITPIGINGPIIQSGWPDFVSDEALGESTFSHSGNFYVRNDVNDLGIGSRVFDFNRCTGELSNPRLIPHEYEKKPWGAEFSASEQFLYFNRPGFVWAYDMFALDFNTTKEVVAKWELNYYPFYPWSTGYNRNQMGPDGKLYFTGGVRSYNIMHAPSNPSDGSNVEEEAFYLSRNYEETINQSPNYRLGKWMGSPCDTISTSAPGFTNTTYDPKKQKEKQTTPKTSYSTVAKQNTSKIPAKISPQTCSMADIQYAKYIYMTTGKLPDNWETSAQNDKAIPIAPQLPFTIPIHPPKE